MTIIFVFDPLAVLLLIASQYTFAWSRQRREEEGEDPKDPTPTNIDEERYEDVSDEELRNEELSDKDKQERDFMFLANAGAPVGDVSSYVIKPEDITITMPEAVTNEVDEPDYVPIEEDLIDEPEDEGEEDPFEELFAEIDAKEEAEAKAKELADKPAHAVTESIYEDPAEVDEEVETTVDPRIEDLPKAPQGTPEEVWLEPTEETVRNDEQEPDEMDKIYSEAQQESARTVRSKSWLSGGFPTKED